MEEHAKNNSNGRIVKILLLIAVLSGCVAICAWLGGEYYVNKRLDNQLAKIQLAGQPLSFPELQAKYSTTIAGEDAAGYYAKGLIAIASANFADIDKAVVLYHYHMTAGSTEQIPEDFQKQVASNLTGVRAISAQFDKAGRLPLSTFDMSARYGRDISDKRMKHIQTAVNLLSLRTLQLSLAGNGNAAAESVISLLKLGRIFDCEPMIVLYSQKVALTRIACGNIAILLRYTKPSKEVLVRLDEALAALVPDDMVERAIIGERVRQIEVIRNIFTKEAARQYLSSNSPVLPERLGLSRRPWVRVRVRWVAGSSLREMADAIEAARLPWPKRLDAIEAKFGDGKGRMGKPMIGIVRLVGTDATLVNSSRLAIAISRYRISTGELPKTLQGLVGKYIDSIPIDPFTGKTLLYQQDGQSYTIYSAGIDRTDDGGKVEPLEVGKVPADCGICFTVSE